MSSGSHNSNFKIFGQILGKIWSPSQNCPYFKFLTQILKFFGIFASKFMSQFKFEILKNFGQNLAKFLSLGPRFLAKFEIRRHSKKDNA